MNWYFLIFSPVGVEWNQFHYLTCFSRGLKQMAGWRWQIWGFQFQLETRASRTILRELRANRAHRRGRRSGSFQGWWKWIEMVYSLRQAGIFFWGVINKSTDSTFQNGFIGAHESTIVLKSVEGNMHLGHVCTRSCPRRFTLGEGLLASGVGAGRDPRRLQMFNLPNCH